jgi:DNA damage-inducible protein 1
MERFTRRITLNIFNPQGGDQDSLVTLEVFSDMTVATLRESVQAEAGIPPAAQHIYHNGRLISDDAKTMEQLQIGDGDMLAVHVRDMRGSTGPPEAAGQTRAAARQQPNAAASATAAAGTENDTEMLRLQILGDPAVRQQLSRQHPELAAALEDPARFRRIFLDSQDRERREREMRQREIERLNEDPFNVENQTRIEEMIRQERVMENLQNAMEHNPEGMYDDVP